MFRGRNPFELKEFSEGERPPVEPTPPSVDGRSSVVEPQPPLFQVTERRKEEPRVEKLNIPPEGIVFPFEVKGRTAELTLKPDYTIWEGERQAGNYLPETNMVAYEPPFPEEGISFTEQGTDYTLMEDSSLWTQGRHIGTLDTDTGEYTRLTIEEARVDRDASRVELLEKYPPTPYTKEQMESDWYKERLAEETKIQDDYEDAIRFAKPFEESLAGRALPTLLEGMEQFFTTAGALITAPFRAEQLGELAREFPVVSPLPGGRGYEQYQEWKGSPEEPAIRLPVPSWEQWGAWLKPVLKNDALLKSLGVDVASWEEPTEDEIARIGFATARLGMGEAAEWIPLIFGGAIASTLKTPETIFTGISKQQAARLLASEVASKDAMIKTTSGGRLVLMPTYEQLMWDTTKQFAGRPEKFIEKPLIRNLVSVFNPKLIARNPIKQFKIYQGIMRDITNGATETAMAKLRVLKMPKLKDRIVIDKRIKPKANAPKIGGRASMDIGDILSYSERYDMPKNLRGWFDEMRAVSRETTEMLAAELKRHDIPMKRLVRENDWVYFHRVVEKINSIENLRMKSYRSMTKPRSLELAGEAAPKGVEFLTNPIAELQYQIEGAYAWITDLRVKDALKKITTTAKERVKPAIIDDLVEKNNIQIAADHLKKLISRAKRGEQLPTVSLNAVDRKFPAIGSQLRTLVTQPASRQKTIALNKLSKQTTELLSVSKNEFWAAKTVYQKALKSAGVGIEEGVTRYTGSRIFTTQELIKPYGHWKFDAKNFRFVHDISGKKVLGRELAEEVERQFGYRVPGLIERGMEKLGTFGGVLRETKASLDFSVQFIQTQLGGLGLDSANMMMGRPSARWIKGTGRSLQAYFRPRSFAKWAGKPEIIRAQQEMIVHRALIQGSEYTEAIGVLAPLLRKTRVGRPLAFLYERANAAFTAGRTSTATYIWIGERQKATRGLRGLALERRLDELGMWINKATGTLSTRGMGLSPTHRALESTFMFAPRYTRAVISSVMDIGKGGYTGAQARESLLGLMAAGTSFFTFMPLALGQTPRLNPLPESMGGDGAKWMTIKVGNSYVGVGGTIYGLARLIANNWAKWAENPDDLFHLDMNNPNVRFIRAKMGPPAALAVDYVTGKDYLGNLTRENWTQVMGTSLDWLIPIWIESAIGEEWFDKVVEGEPLDLHPEAAPFEIGGLRTIPVTEYDEYMTLRETYAQRDLGVSYRDIEDKADRAELFRNHLDLAEARDIMSKDFETRGNKFQRFYNELVRTTNEERNAKLEIIATALLSGDITKQEYDTQRTRIRTYSSAYKAALWRAREEFDERTIKSIEKYGEDLSNNDKALDEYQEIRSMPDIDPRTGLPNWDMMDNRLAKFLATLSASEKKYVLDHKDDYIFQYGENAQQVERTRLQGIEDETWWDDYRGTGRVTSITPSARRTTPSGKGGVEDLLRRATRK